MVAATNIDITEAIRNGKFRQDLFYRLNTVPIYIPPLRKRKEDIHLLFRKFAADFAEKYHMPVIQLDVEARNLLINYSWPGNIRQLKNITEQISIIEESRTINANTLRKYLPEHKFHDLPILYDGKVQSKELSERDLLYKVLFDMKKDITELKKIVGEILQSDEKEGEFHDTGAPLVRQLDQNLEELSGTRNKIEIHQPHDDQFPESILESEVLEESLSLQKKEIEMINKALEKHNGKRKNAARELGISERTLYRKIKEYNIA